MFPSSNFSRRYLGATLAIAISAMFAAPAFAATPLLKSVPTEALGAERVLDDSARPAPTTPIHLSFALSTIKQDDLKSYADDVSNPTSPIFRKWLTPQQIGERFGAPISDINTVVAYLNKQGFSNVKIWPSRMFVSAQAPRATVEKTFGIEIHGYDRDAAHVARGYSQTFYAPDRNPMIDASVAGKLTGIFGLSNAVQRVPFKVHPDLAADGSLKPSDLSAVYGNIGLHNAGDYGAGQTIAIYSPTTFADSDITAFEEENDITGTDITIVEVNGGSTDTTDSGEACLDIETIIGQAPAATVNVYEGPNDGSFDIFNQMLTDDPNIVSESYGTDETAVTATYAASYEVVREAMAAEGISIFVSSGDNGAYDSDTQTTVTTSVDTTSEYVTSVGGTELLPFAPPESWNGEIAWSYNDATLGKNSGSGGGLSIYYPRPAWQTGTGVNNSYSNGMRQVPDVAACASSPYYEIYSGGANVQVGGTSASCPLWASSFALVEESAGIRFGCVNPELYALAASNPSLFHDITSGSNGVYPCTVGWDFVTGWGSTFFSALAANIAGSPYAFPGGLQMISVPYVYSGATVSELFTGLVTSAGATASDIAAWVPADQNYVETPAAPANTPVPGQGYWARFKSSTGGTLTASGIEINTPYYGVTLQPGWNMVGDPYVNAVEIDNLQVSDGSGTHTFAAAVAAGDVSSIFYSYGASTGYVANTFGAALAPFAGYWIYAGVNCQLTFFDP